MGAGVAGALKRAGGAEIEREAMAQGPIERGTAVATRAGRLAARFVIHGAVMGQGLTTDAGLVRQTTRACLALADELGCASLALPAVAAPATGVERLAYVPRPYGVLSVSPSCTSTSSGGMPSSSATTCAIVVSMP